MSETDILFSVFDTETNKVAAFQIKREAIPLLGIHLTKLADTLREGVRQ